MVLCDDKNVRVDPDPAGLFDPHFEGDLPVETFLPQEGLQILEQLDHGPAAVLEGVEQAPHVAETPADPVAALLHLPHPFLFRQAQEHSRCAVKSGKLPESPVGKRLSDQPVPPILPILIAHFPHERGRIEQMVDRFPVDFEPVRDLLCLDPVFPADQAVDFSFQNCCLLGHGGSSLPIRQDRSRGPLPTPGPHLRSGSDFPQIQRSLYRPQGCNTWCCPTLYR